MDTIYENKRICKRCFKMYDLETGFTKNKYQKGLKGNNSYQHVCRICYNIQRKKYNKDAYEKRKKNII